MNRTDLCTPGEEIVETDRLIMRRLRPDDYLAMAAWDMDERVYKYLMSPACKNPEDPLVWLPKKDPTSKINILMLVMAKEDGHVVGIYSAVCFCFYLHGSRTGFRYSAVYFGNDNG